MMAATRMPTDHVSGQPTLIIVVPQHPAATTGSAAPQAFDSPARRRHKLALHVARRPPFQTLGMFEQVPRRPEHGLQPVAVD